MTIYNLKPRELQVLQAMSRIPLPATFEAIRAELKLDNHSGAQHPEATTRGVRWLRGLSGMFGFSLPDDPNLWETLQGLGKRGYIDLIDLAFCTTLGKTIRPPRHYSLTARGRDALNMAKRLVA